MAPKEGQVLEMLIQGYPHKKIASVMRIVERTVDTYAKRLREEFHVDTKPELIVAALGAGGWEEGRRMAEPVQVIIDIDPRRANVLTFRRVYPGGYVPEPE